MNINPDQQIEAAALEVLRNPSTSSVANALELSTAISLKRIADIAETWARGSFNYDPALTPEGKPR